MYFVLCCATEAITALVRIPGLPLLLYRARPTCVKLDRMPVIVVKLSWWGVWTEEIETNSNNSKPVVYLVLLSLV